MATNEQPPLNVSRESSPWLKLAKDAFENSTSYIDNNYRNQWERNISLFRSQHPKGSKYHSKEYTHRSRLFRPKTRSAIRTNEAACAAAFFSTDDVVSVRPENDADDKQRASARVLKHILQYRLTKTIPWFQTIIAAYQETLIFGTVCSYQYWEYSEKKKTVTVPLFDEDGNTVVNEDGSEATEKVEEVDIIKDKPVIRLIAAENLRIDSASDWFDPINSSPYVVEIIPMYLQDVIEKMSEVDSKTGMPKWRTLTVEELLSSASRSENDSTRQSRHGRRQDPATERRNDNSMYSTIFIHKNTIKKNGKDWCYFTAGTDYMLTDPKPLTELYPHLQDGERPYVLGNAIIEAHKSYPSSLVEMTQDLQTAANDIANQRTDNVQLVLNKRYHIRRSANIDIHSLKRSVPGGSVMMDDPMRDIQIVNTPDVTASSYEEQDRLNVDFDDIAGHFSQGTVQTNRMMNETVGGMEMLSSDANSQMEYMIRTFAETWVEPVLRQLVRLEQYYETDDVVMNTSLNSAADEDQDTDYYQFTGDAADDLLRQNLIVNVNVGIGATDPQRKIEKLLLGMRTMTEIVPDFMNFIDQKEIAREVFGALGYKDSSRFLTEEPPARMEEMQAQLEQQGQILQQLTDQGAAKQIDAQSKIVAATIKAQSDVQAAKEKAKGDIFSTQIASDSRERIDSEQRDLRRQLSLIDSRIKAEKNDIARGELLLQKESLVHKMMIDAEPEIGLDEEGKKMSEVLMNDQYGKIQGAEG